MNAFSRTMSIAGVAVAMLSTTTADAAEWECTYVPKTETGPWEWNTKANWLRDWSPFDPLGWLPYSSTVEESLYMFAPALTKYPLTVPSGTVANCYQLSIGTVEKYCEGTDASPYLLEICGGVLTNHATAYLGYRNAGVKSARSAKITVSSGSWTSLADVYFGGASTNCWLDIGTAGSVNAPVGTFYVGAANQATGIVTNRGTMAVNNLQLGNDFANNTAGSGKTVGRVANYGTLNVASNVLIGAGTTSVGEFDNYGALNVGRQMTLGCKSGSTMGVYRHHAGATLTKPVANYRWFYVGNSSPARFIVDGGTLSFGNSSERFFVGMYMNAAEASSLEIVNGGSLSVAGAVTLGCDWKAYGRLLLDGEGSEMKGSGWINAGNWYSYNQNARAGIGDIIVTNKATLSVDSVYLGCNTKAIGTLTVTDGGRVSGMARLEVGSMSEASGTTRGVVNVIGENSMITNLIRFYIGSKASRNTGLVNMKGGQVFYRSAAGEFNLGYDGTTSSGAIRGWGRIAVMMNDREEGKQYYMGRHCGTVTADGEGEMRDLDMMNMWSLGSDSLSANPNAIGTNGWYAVNKGRLRLPHNHRMYELNARCVGDYVMSSSPRLVNSFRIQLNGAAKEQFIWADLYSTDRTDIPSGMPLREGEKMLSVYRVGYFTDHDTFDDPTHPSAFTTATATFNYGALRSQAGHKIRVYHHDGSAQGTWTRVGSADYSAESPLVSTRTVAASSENWNGGWFAVTDAPGQGLSLIVR